MLPTETGSHNLLQLQMPPHSVYHHNPWNWFFLSVRLCAFSQFDTGLLSLFLRVPSLYSTWYVCVVCVRYSFHASFVASRALLINKTLCCCCVWHLSVTACVWVGCQTAHLQWSHYSVREFPVYQIDNKWNILKEGKKVLLTQNKRNDQYVITCRTKGHHSWTSKPHRIESESEAQLRRNYTEIQPVIIQLFDFRWNKFPVSCRKQFMTLSSLSDKRGASIIYCSCLTSEVPVLCASKLSLRLATHQTILSKI